MAEVMNDFNWALNATRKKVRPRRVTRGDRVLRSSGQPPTHWPACHRRFSFKLFGIHLNPCVHNIALALQKADGHPLASDVYVNQRPKSTRVKDVLGITDPMRKTACKWLGLRSVQT